MTDLLEVSTFWLGLNFVYGRKISQNVTKLFWDFLICKSNFLPLDLVCQTLLLSRIHCLSYDTYYGLQWIWSGERRLIRLESAWLCQYSVWSGFPRVPISALLSVFSLGDSRPVWLHGGHFVTMGRSELCLGATLGILIHFGIFILKLTF